jgi:hypothetical protein
VLGCGRGIVGEEVLGCGRGVDVAGGELEIDPVCTHPPCVLPHDTIRRRRIVCCLVISPMSPIDSNTHYSCEKTTHLGDHRR